MESKINEIYKLLESAGEGTVPAKDIISKLDDLHLKEFAGRHHNGYAELWDGMSSFRNFNDLSDFFASHLYKIIGVENSIVTISECYNDNTAFSTECIKGNEVVVSMIQHMVANNELSVIMPNQVKDPSVMFENRLIRVPTLNEFIHQSLPDEACEKIEAITDLHYFYGYPVSEGPTIIATISMAVSTELSEEKFHELERIIKVARQFFIMLYHYQKTDRLNRQMSEIFNQAEFAFVIFASDGRIINSNTAFKELFEPLGSFGLFDRKFQELIGIESTDEILNGHEIRFAVPAQQYDKLPLLVNFSLGRITPVKTTNMVVSYYLVFLHSRKGEMRIRETLELGEKKYKRMFNHIQDIYFEIKLDGTILEISPSVQRYIDIPIEKLIGSNILDLYADPAARESYLAEITQKGRVSNYEIDFMLPNGKILTSMVVASLIDKGTPDERVVGSMVDISELKIKTKEIKENEIKFRSLFNTSPIGILISDTQGNIVDINNSLLKIFESMPADAVRNMNIFTNENVAKFGLDGFIKEVKRTGKPTSTEKSYTDYSGNKKFFRINISSIPDSLGRMLYLLLMAEDVTALKAKEAELEQTRDRFLDIYNNTSDLIYTMDFEGNFTSVNPVAEKWLGYRFQDLPNTNMSQFISHDSVKRAQEQIKLKLTSGADLSTYEVTAFTRNKEKMTLEINSFLRYKNGKPIEVFGIARDITERKKHEEFISMALRERERLIMEVHHRVKNNLQLILSMLKMYSYTFDDEKMLQTFRDLIQKIMAISAAHEDFYFSTDFTDIDFKNYLTTVVISSIEQFDFKNRTSYVIESENLKAGIDDVIPLGLIVSELLSNSIRYGANAEDKVKLYIGFHNKGKKHELIVQDEGPGIPASVIENAGHSLGLSLVAMLAENQLGGCYKIDSNEKGTKITIEF